MTILKTSIRAIVSLLAVLCVKTSYAYSVLAHEALIDSCWLTAIQPLLLSKYPEATKAQLKRAHAYAYGGAIAPDIGYFPFGNPFFTNLVHYVRSGDFVNALLDDARDIDEYAFALGFLSHYMADKYGHSLATNKSVPLLYVKEREKYGNTVTYEEDHLSHKRVEFAFDALQSVEGDYSRIAYHDFIGFRISGSLLDRAFTEVYGLDIHKVFFNFPLSIFMLRWSFKRVFPALTGAAWVLKRKQLKKAHHGEASKSYLSSIKNGDKDKDLSMRRHVSGVMSGLFSRVYVAVFAVFIEFVPKVGPLRPMKFKTPGPEVAKLYFSSFDTTVKRYVAALRDCRAGRSRLANIDFDTGNFTTPGEYGLADKNYDILVVKLEKDHFKLLNSELRENITDFYSHRTPPTGSRKVENAWNKTEVGLQRLETAKVAKAE